jgi:hypothetical protein
VHRVRRVVTGHDAQGRSKVILDGPADTVTEIGYDCRVSELWAAYGPRPSNAGTEDAAKRATSVRTPPPYGNKFRVIEFAPDERVDMHALDERLRKGMESGRMLGEVKGELHRSESIDYVIVLQGEVWHLTETDEVHLRAGDVLVQRGTYHAWRNRSKDPVLLAIVLCDAAPLRVRADPLEAARKREVLAALDAWIAAMNAGQGPAPLMKLYAEDAALFATLNPELLVTPEGRAGNFNGLADRQKKKGYRAELGTVVTHLFADAAVNTGYYTFRFVENDGRPVVSKYRFSFTYRKAPEGWLIVSHHSSPCPERNMSPQPERR